MVENACNLIEHGADIACAQRRLDTQQLFDCQHITVLVAHHRDVVEAVHVADALVERLAFSQLFGAAMQQADMRICAHDGFTVHLENQTQHAVCSRMLRTKVDRIITYLRHRLAPPQARLPALVQVASSPLHSGCLHG